MTTTAKIADLRSLADHARVSHAYWLREARRPGRYGGAYALAGAGVWRRRLAEILRALRAAEAAQR